MITRKSFACQKGHRWKHHCIFFSASSRLAKFRKLAWGQKGFVVGALPPAPLWLRPWYNNLIIYQYTWKRCVVTRASYANRAREPLEWAALEPLSFVYVRVAISLRASYKAINERIPSEFRFTHVVHILCAYLSRFSRCSRLYREHILLYRERALSIRTTCL